MGRTSQAPFSQLLFGRSREIKDQPLSCQPNVCFAEKLQDLTNYSFLKNAFRFASFFKFTVTHEVLCSLVLFLLFMPTSVLRYNLVITHQNVSTSILKFSSFLCFATCDVSPKPRHMHVLILVKILIPSSSHHWPISPAQPPQHLSSTPTSANQTQSLHRGPNTWSLGEPKRQVPLHCTLGVVVVHWIWDLQVPGPTALVPSKHYL